MRRIGLTTAAGLGAALAALALALAVPAPAAARDEPIVVQGSQLEKLIGTAPERVVAFRYKRTRTGRHEKWRQIPVQVDERKLVDFGDAPPSNSAPGSDGTVYGTAPIGVTALQYADAQTFVGADGDPTLDGDDEVALMSADAGDRARRHSVKPKRVRGSTRLKVADPLGGPPRYVYLFAATGNRRSGAGQDYVAYDFSLDSGGYKATYNRAAGPNPEHSTISTGTYSAGFTDRWFFDQLTLPGGADLLDGFKFQFAPNSCARSEATFNQGEGAFVANVDGPVRAIRSYVGANSGPLTERTHFFYRDRHLLVTDLRVHAIPGQITYHDLSTAGIGMTYFDSVNRGGATVDGIPDQLDSSTPAWHMWTGAQGTLWSADRVQSSFADALYAGASGWYVDDSTPAPLAQCWGDDQAIGQGGLRTTSGAPDTDPRNGATDFLRATTTDVMSPAAAGLEQADRLSTELDTPLALTPKPVKLSPRH